MPPSRPTVPSPQPSWHGSKPKSRRTRAWTIFNETSRRASSEFSGEVNLKYGSYDYRQFSTTFTGPVTDSVDARFTGLYLDRNAETVR